MNKRIPVKLVLRSRQIRIAKDGLAPMLMLEALSKTTAGYFRRITNLEEGEHELWFTFDLKAVDLRLIYNYIKQNLPL